MISGLVYLCFTCDIGSQCFGLHFTSHLCQRIDYKGSHKNVSQFRVGRCLCENVGNSMRFRNVEEVESTPQRDTTERLSVCMYVSVLTTSTNRVL